MRKANQKRLLRGRFDRIFVNSFKTGDIGPDLCRKACEFRLEGRVSKRSGRPYRGGRSKDWLKEESEPSTDRRVEEAFGWTGIRIIRHEAVSQTGSFEVRFPDGRPVRFFTWRLSRPADAPRSPGQRHG
jgi:hypothetical protein